MGGVDFLIDLRHGPVVADGHGDAAGFGGFRELGERGPLLRGGFGRFGDRLMVEVPASAISSSATGTTLVTGDDSHVDSLVVVSGGGH